MGLQFFYFENIEVDCTRDITHDLRSLACHASMLAYEHISSFGHEHISTG